MDLDSFLVSLYVTVDEWWLASHAPTWTPRPSGRLGSPHPSHPRPVAAFSQREGILALRRRAPASLLPEPLHPGPVQPQGARPGVRVARLAAGLRQRSQRSFGGLPRLGH